MDRGAGRERDGSDQGRSSWPHSRINRPAMPAARRWSPKKRPRGRFRPLDLLVPGVLARRRAFTGRHLRPTGLRTPARRSQALYFAFFFAAFFLPFFLAFFAMVQYSSARRERVFKDGSTLRRRARPHPPLTISELLTSCLERTQLSTRKVQAPPRTLAPPRTSRVTRAHARSMIARRLFSPRARHTHRSLIARRSLAPQRGILIEPVFAARFHASGGPRDHRSTHHPHPRSPLRRTPAR